MGLMKGVLLRGIRQKIGPERQPSYVVYFGDGEDLQRALVLPDMWGIPCPRASLT